MVHSLAERRLNRKPVTRMRIVGFALWALLLFPLLTGCFVDNSNDRPAGQSNVEFLHLLTLDSDDYEDANRPESLAFVSETTLAIGTGYDGVYFADLSDPEEPVVISVFEYEGYGVSSVFAMDGYVYGFTPSGDLLAIDARQPTAPELADRIRGQEGDTLLAAGDGHLYVKMRGGIQIWNAADPYALALVGVYYPPQTRARGPFMDRRLGVPPSPHQLEAEKAYGAFIAHEDFPFESLPCGRRFIENADVLGAAIYDELLYVWVETVFCVGPEEEIVSHMTVTEGGRQSGPTPIIRPVVREAEHGGFWVLDVSEPAEPLAVGFLSLQDFVAGLVKIYFVDTYDITVAANYVYLTPRGDLSGDLAIVDVSDPGRPVILDNQMNADLVVWEDNSLYVSEVFTHKNFLNADSYSNSLQVFDGTEAANPVRIGMMAESPGVGTFFGELQDIAVRAGYIYLAEHPHRTSLGGGIHVLRLIDPHWRPDISPTGASDD